MFKFFKGSGRSDPNRSVDDERKVAVSEEGFLPADDGIPAALCLFVYTDPDIRLLFKVYWPFATSDAVGLISDASIEISLTWHVLRKSTGRRMTTEERMAAIPPIERDIIDALAAWEPRPWNVKFVNIDKHFGLTWPKQQRVPPDVLLGKPLRKRDLH